MAAPTKVEPRVVVTTEVVTLEAEAILMLLIDWSDAKTEYTLFWMLLGLPLLLSAVCGGVPAFLIWHRIRNKQKKEQEKAPNRPSYYQT